MPGHARAAAHARPEASDRRAAHAAYAGGDGAGGAQPVGGAWNVRRMTFPGRRYGAFSETGRSSPVSRRGLASPVSRRGLAIPLLAVRPDPHDALLRGRRDEAPVGREELAEREPSRARRVRAR